MGKTGYYIFYGLNWIFTLLPLRVLYLFSDLIFPLIYYFPGYRRKVVRTNLANSFPEKTLNEIITVEKKFYHHLCDLFIETFKLTHMSEKQIMKRISFSNPGLLKKLLGEGRDVVAVLGHYCNWEWLTSLPLWAEYNFVSIYKPLSNKSFDQFMIDCRSQYGMTLTPMQHVVRDVLQNRNKNLLSLYSFLTDQTPPKNDIRFRTSFLNQDTPVYLGAEKIASKYDMALIFINIQKIRRGYYSFSAELLFEHTKGIQEHLITETHVRRLEEIIREKPEYWVWSHRRWKHKRETPDD
ncbi:MAG TPA: lysophospholipid acyltransferase family protein [Bacteroidales bacterium]|nr:lysophospholipid acyltransferase family protein [Bacteroidales bacterium]HPF03328.1 lysophospholipid acyltransferase family protein [Bacteroidales bacterium]HPJ59173.1 lysophospholipid acyltransferase family protein [Bacteroidales bacterium]HPR12785.1 lysophospholipid acyltransferase family protein [Bacteroidales bacterium]HRW84389.1 lysophospholipid acyltransferase family protein [Bacteroidales bacterium]